MAGQVWTVHHRAGRELEVIADRLDLLALVLPPVWVLWHRCWLTLAAMIVLPNLVQLVWPLGGMPVLYGIALILFLEGGTIRRAELAIRGWQEVGVVLAETEEGAEELYLNGQLA